MLRLFAGRENIDKERFIYDRIKEAGGEALVLVPDQYTLVAEEQALSYLGTDCLFNVEILSMNRLGLRVLTEQGTESVRMIDKYGRFMLLALMVRERSDDFDIFSKVAGKVSFISMLNDFISEFKQQDCTIDELKRMTGDTNGDPILEAKLNELSGVISAYEEAIRGRYTDSEDYISMYVDAIADSKLVKGKNIWIYGYDSITPKFAGAVMQLARTAESVNFIVNKSDFGLDEMLSASLAKLADESGVSMGTALIDDSYVTEKSETIKRMEKYLWKDVLTAKAKAENADFDPEDLTLVRAANPYYEAETAAAYIWHLVRDLGYKMREIQVVANDEGSMQPIIRRVFAEYGLPVFADAARDITDSAAVGFITGLLDFIVHRGSSQYLFAALKTGLTDIEDSDIEDLENYVREYRIKGSMWDRPFKYGEERIGEEDFEKIESLRAKLSASTCRLAAISENTGAGTFIKAFKSYLDDDWHLAQKTEEAAAMQDAAGFHDEAQRLQQSYIKAMELLDQMDEVMGGAELDISEFTEIYKAGLSDVEVGVIPPTADGLSMGTMIRTRPRRMKAAVILGANEGVLPLSPQTEGLFSVDEKEFFKSKGFALGSLDDIRMDEENTAMYRMMARPSEKIYISWSMTDSEGKDTSPSQVIDSIKTLFPRIDADGLIKKDMVSEGFAGTLAAGAADRINTEGDGMRQLIRRIKDSNEAAEPDVVTRALVKWYSDNRRDKLNAMMSAAAYDNVQKPLSRATARALFGRRDGSLVMSASSIDGYIDCPFKYFVERGLKPAEERTFASDSRSVGDVYHECLMAVARQIMSSHEIIEKIRENARSGGEADSGGDPLEALVTAALDDLSQNYRGGLFISTGGEEYRMSRIREICFAAAKAMAAQLSAETVTGAVFEEKFGRHGGFAPIKIECSDGEVYVEGKIDRADMINVGGEDRVRIIDYKTGSDRLDLWKMRQGYKMQLMIYLISASTGGHTPAGMFYFNIKDPIESANDKSEKQMDSLSGRAAEDEFKLKGAFINEDGVLGAMPEKVLSSAKGGISREEYEEIRSDVLARIEETAEGILGGKIPISPLKNDNQLACRYCSCKSVCRRDRGYVKNSSRPIRSRPKEKE